MIPAPDDYSENALVEQPAIALFHDLGWHTANCFYEQYGPRGTLGRETKGEVVLTSRLRPALERLNPTLDGEAIRLAIEELTRDRSAMSPAQANREVYQLLKNGVKVTVKGGADGEEETVETVRVIDWKQPANFAATGAVIEQQAQAASGEHLAQLLRENHRYVFTLIQKFHTERGEKYPKLSDRSDIIVMTDEAHRSQYDLFALNMRNALPRAAFIGFTGTPLMVGEEKTREVFGDYVSVYNFRQSVEDGATVPLYYENRVPELQLTNPDLNADMEKLLEDAELDQDQERKLERDFAREYHLITRDDRLETVARDLVTHFLGRGQKGKAMVVSIDKATAVRMYDKVQKHWRAHLDDLKTRLAAAPDDQRPALQEQIQYLEGTDMAVVVSQSQNEIEEMKKGLDIVPHRKRVVAEDLDTKFKDPADPFRIVFVCAMWMTGFPTPRRAHSPRRVSSWLSSPRKPGR
jgi:type I site-specific restriction-modification system R (restriction) subunit